jgi:hypothetical protein
MARRTIINRLSCMTAAAETAMLLAIRVLYDQHAYDRHAYDRHAPWLSARLTRRGNSPEAVSDPAQGDSRSNPRRFTMRHARRAIAILIGFATGFIATATVAYASLTARDPAVAPANPHEVPGFYNSYQHVASSTSAAGRPLWQILAFVALGVLLAVAIVGLGYSRSHSRKSQTPLRS